MDLAENTMISTRRGRAIHVLSGLALVAALLPLAPASPTTAQARVASVSTARPLRAWSADRFVAWAPPSQPTKRSLEATRTRISYAWNQSLANGSAVTGYVVSIRRKTSTGWTEWFASPVPASNGMTYRWTRRKADRTYQVRVRANSAAGPSIWSPKGSITTNVPAGYRMVWNADFSDGLDPRWHPYDNNYGLLMLQAYRPANVGVSDGTLKLTARRQSYRGREFTSGFLGTRETGNYFPRFARYEMRAKTPHGQGLWPAFWLRHRDGSSVAEVDVMEYFHSSKPGWYTGSLHLDGESRNKGMAFESTTTTPGWHRYSVDISLVTGGVKFEFALDDKVWFTYVDTTPAWASRHRGKLLFDIAVQFGVGGPYVADPDGPLGYLEYSDRCAQSRGTPPDRCATTGIRRAAFAERFEIDWVRVFARN